MLRDCFVVGLANASDQRVLLTEVGLTLQRALCIAVARETADFKVRKMGGRKEGQLLHQVVSRQDNRPAHNDAIPRLKLTYSAKPNPCFGFGKLHWRRCCPYRNSECFNCKKKEHFLRRK